jgi:regulator of cell morphogenesis and NO signaling
LKEGIMLKTNLGIHSLINEFTKEDMSRAKVLEELGIDACCGGNKSLATACGEKGLDPDVVLKLLLPVEKPEEPAKEEENWEEESLTDLVAHIEATHHVYLKQALPNLSSQIKKVVEAHGERHPELSHLERAFTLLRADLEPHMMKEERVLFPMVCKMESGAGLEQFHCGTLQGPIGVMQAEHRGAEALQEEIRRITDDFTLPADGCETYRLMLEALKNLDADLNVHIHKENDILFPRVLDAEGHLL